MDVVRAAIVVLMIRIYRIVGYSRCLSGYYLQCYSILATTRPFSNVSLSNSLNMSKCPINKSTPTLMMFSSSLFC